MIKTEFGMTRLEGNYAVIMTDYVAITSSMIDFLIDKKGHTAAEAKDILIEAFEMGFDNKETIDEAMAKLDDFDGSMSDFLADVLAKVIVKLEKEEAEEGEK